MTKTNSFSSRTKLAASVATAAMGLALASSPAYAQDDVPGVSGTPGQATEEATSGGPIVVTGTRIQRPDLESVSPVTVVGAQDIADTGTTRTEDLLNSLPQVFAAQNAFVVNGASGTATVDLRGLGPIRTLVLVDGRRLMPGDPFAVTADLNLIPASLIERIEVVTGGASAVYGADAVAGVVNFIMDRDFEGIRADAQVSFYQHDNDADDIQDLLARSNVINPQGNVVDGIGYDANLVLGAGFDDGRGHVTAYLGYRQIDAITQATRDYSACSLAFSASDPTGYSCSGSGGSVNGNFLNFSGPPPVGVGTTTGTPAFPDGTSLTLDENSDGFRPFGAGDVFNFNPQNFFQRPDKRYVGGFFAEYEISPSVVPYAEFMFMDDLSDAQIASTGTFNGNSPVISCGNPLLSDLQATQLGCASDDESLYLYINKRLIEAGPRSSALRHTAYRMVAGVRGEISSDWRYDFSAQRGTTIFSQQQINDASADRIDQALDVVVLADGTLACRDTSNGCLPLNVFDIGGVTPEAADFITINGIIEGETTTYVVNGYVTGNIGSLWAADPIGVVLGAEYRKEIYGVFPDDINERGALTGLGGPTPQVEGRFSVRELFAEINAPLFDFGNGGGVVLEAGYRYSDYTTTGGSHTYKAGATIEPIPGIRFRGIFNRAERAPNVVELFSPNQIALFGGTDPCAGILGDFLPDGVTPNTANDPTASAAACANTGLSAGQYGTTPINTANQYNQLVGGNVNLAPEKADTYTVGAVIDGGEFGIGGFTATVDYFNISIDGAVQGIGAQQSLNTCLATGDPIFCNLINRSPSGSLFIGQQGFVINTQQNIGGIRTTGIDFSAGYRFPLGAGSLFANIVGTYLMDYEFQNTPDLEFYDCTGFFGTVCGTPNPEYRHRLSVGYTSDAGWGLTGRWRYYGSVDVDSSSSDPQLTNPGVLGTVDDSIKAYSWFDLSASYDFTDNFQLTAGVNNILDTNPPTIGASAGGAALNGNIYAGQYDPVGRYVFIGGRIQF